MDFVWIYEYGGSFHKKSGYFLELEYSMQSVRKFYKDAECYVAASPHAQKKLKDLKKDYNIIDCPNQVLTHVTNHPDHFDVLNKFTKIIEDDRVGEEFILMYDDIFLLQPMTKADFKTYGKHEVDDVAEFLQRKEGKDYVRGGSVMYREMWKATYNYITIERKRSGQKMYDWETHLPRLMEKTKLKDVIDSYGLKYVPMLITSLYSHEYGGETTLMDEMTQSDLYTYKPTKHDLEHEFSKKFLNLGDDACTPEIIEIIKNLVK